MPEINPVIGGVTGKDRYSSTTRQSGQEPFSITGEVEVPVKAPVKGAESGDTTKLAQQRNQLLSDLSSGILKATQESTNLEATQMRDLVTATKILMFSEENMSQELKEKIFISPEDLQQMLIQKDKGETSFSGEAFDILRLIAKMGGGKTDMASAMKQLAQLNQNAQANAQANAQTNAQALLQMAGEAADDLAQGAVSFEFSGAAAAAEAEAEGTAQAGYGQVLAEAMAGEAGGAEKAAAAKAQTLASSLSQAVAGGEMNAAGPALENEIVTVLRHFDCYTNQDNSLEAIAKQLETLNGKVFSADKPTIAAFAEKLQSLMQEGKAVSDGQTNPYTQIKGELAGKDVLNMDREVVAKTQNFLMDEMMPELSKLVSKYNQAGAVRDPVMSIVHYVARYDRADAGKLETAIDNMTEALRNVPNLTEQDVQELKTLLLDAARDIRVQQKTEGMEKSFLGQFGAAADDGDMMSFIADALDKDSPARVQKLAMNLLTTMVDNESPTMPLEHFMIPIDFNGNETYLEMYVDKECEGRKGKADSAVNIFFTIESDDYGTFEVDMLERDGMIDLDIRAPQELQKEVKGAKAAIRQSIENSGFRLALYRVAPYNASAPAAEHFKELREKQSGIDIKV
ncbi:MAG: hypothetical protein J5622_04330 [Firmicutes bacterium]|nr:hypothetical protein [Bacillota bacterium]